MNIFNNLMFFLWVERSFEGSTWYLVQLVVVTISTAVIYKKLNQPWWAAFVPIYSEIILLRIAKLKWYWIGFIIMNFIVYFMPPDFKVLWMLSFAFQMGEFGVHLFAYLILSEKFNRGILLPFVMLIFPVIAFPILAIAKPFDYYRSGDHEKWTKFFTGRPNGIT